MPLPAAVAMARSTGDVAEVLKFANEHRINVVPRTGRTATEGGLETSVAELDRARRLGHERILKIDTYNMQATVQCGVPLQVLEDEVRKLGVTTGHSPQSKPIAQMGGLVATRSIGQFSTLYGGIEDMVVGLEAVFPGGTGHADQERPAPCGRPRHPPRRDRQRGRALLHHRSHGEAVPVPAAEQYVRRLDAEEHADRVRGAARGDGRAATGRRSRACTTRRTARSTSRSSPPRTTACCCSWPRARPGSRRRRSTGIEEIVARFPECRPVDSSLIADWFADLNWGPDKIDRRGRAHPHDAQREPHDRDLRRLELDQRHLRERPARGSGPRCRTSRWPGGHSSHSYVNGTNMYFIYFYNL